MNDVGEQPDSIYRLEPALGSVLLPNKELEQLQISYVSLQRIISSPVVPKLVNVWLETCASSFIRLLQVEWGNQIVDLRVSTRRRLRFKASSRKCRFELSNLELIQIVWQALGWQRFGS